MSEPGEITIPTSGEDASAVLRWQCVGKHAEGRGHCEQVIWLPKERKPQGHHGVAVTVGEGGRESRAVPYWAHEDRCLAGIPRAVAAAGKGTRGSGRTPDLASVDALGAKRGGEQAAS